MSSDKIVKPPTTSDYYFFVHHLIATTVLICSIGISLLPRATSKDHQYHIVLQFLLDLLPDRRWLIWSECLGLMGMMFAYSGLNLYREDVVSPALDDYKTIMDSSGNMDQSIGDQLPFLLHEQTSGVVDLPITAVCQVLYGE